ncbi:pyrimidine reductase family protein [Arthrobacter sp. 35W]|uniref:pyrimidine reductase family protein n=1 Tax=Arthrobacter sp. 35W TaxID=1132441 RepID=UPI000415B3BD|nr:pyrimidine reductase family protein [Arthrobacter sp. 35W]
MTGAPIERLFPAPGPVLDPSAAGDAQLLEWYSAPAGVDPGTPWVSFNFVASLDGAATVDGRSGGLGNAADQRIFSLLRRHADVVLVGAQTIRAEGYAGELLNAAGQQWRRENGKSAHPAVAVVSGSLDLDPAGEFFTLAPVRPIIITTASAPAARRAALSAVADVVDAGDADLDINAVVAVLAERGLLRIHSEGGPHVLGSFTAAGRVDELCLTLSPALAGAGAGRITAGPAAADLASMELAHVLRSGSMLFLRYLRSKR